MAGLPFHVNAPKVLRIELRGHLPEWVSAKDIILEVLRRIGVKGGIGKVLEYAGDGVRTLGVYERSTIANMGQETGATGTVFPSDENTCRFLRSQGREEDFEPLEADDDAEYDEELFIQLDNLEPLAAQPWSPGNVVPVSEIEGMEVKQVAVGSSVNSSYRDLMIVAKVLAGKHIAPGLHMTLSPGSRQILLNLLREGVFMDVIKAGVRALEVACGPCIGMGAAPPTGGVSIRTFNRNFRGRSGTKQDCVYLVSPETAAATALAGVLTDPRSMGKMPRIEEPKRYLLYTDDFIEPPKDGSEVEIVRGPNIAGIPEVPRLTSTIKGKTLLRLGDDVSTDDILPGGNEILPLRSNLPKISEHTYSYVDEDFPERARKAKGGIIVAGENFGQGSSREHAAAAQMYLGVRAVLAKDFARIHEANLVNFGVAPLKFMDAKDYERIKQGDEIEIRELRDSLESGEPIRAKNLTRDFDFQLTHGLSERQVEMLLAGGLIRWIRKTLAREERRGAADEELHPS
jgi:aconitate hydratase